VGVIDVVAMTAPYVPVMTPPAIIVRAQPLFQGIKWAGAGYLALLGALAIVSAVRGRYQQNEPPAGGQDAASARRAAGWWQGLLCSFTRKSLSSTWPCCRSFSCPVRAWDRRS
jgi:threonine/homoserine/homoserine lactone efflux protein